VVPGTVEDGILFLLQALIQDIRKEGYDFTLHHVPENARLGAATDSLSCRLVDTLFQSLR
jgi:hypothetical protein